MFTVATETHVYRLKFYHFMRRGHFCTKVSLKIFQDGIELNTLIAYSKCNENDVPNRHFGKKYALDNLFKAYGGEYFNRYQRTSIWNKFFEVFPKAKGSSVPIFAVKWAH